MYQINCKSFKQDRGAKAGGRTLSVLQAGNRELRDHHLAFCPTHCIGLNVSEEI